MRQKNLQLLEKVELLEIAARLKVCGRHAMKKESLVKAILAAERDLKKQDKKPARSTTKKGRPAAMKPRRPSQKDTDRPMAETEERLKLNRNLFCPFLIMKHI
jgi:hypothetical protein